MTRKIVWLLAFLFAAVPVSAQTVNPTRAAFTASADHNQVIGSVSQVDRYQLDVMVSTVNGVLAFTKDLGKPTPNAQNEIVVTIPEFATMAQGQYVATVSASGPGGVARSQPSAPFLRVSAPAAPTQVGVRP